MKTTFDVIQELYRTINVTNVTSLLTGGVNYPKRPEENFGKTDVVIVPLADVNINDYVREGVLNVNVYAAALSNKMVDVATIKSIVDAITVEIESHANASNYYKFNLQGQGMVTDERDETAYNVRVGFYCEY